MTTEGRAGRYITQTDQSLVSLESAKRPAGESLLASDERIRQILARFGQLLHRGIAEAGNFEAISYGATVGGFVPMLADELSAWNKYFGIENTVSSLAEQGRLFVPHVAGQGNYEVHLDEEQWIQTPIAPFDPTDTRFVISPTADFVGSHQGEEGLHQASLGLEVYVQDSQGRWAVSRSAGTDETPILGREAIVYTQIQFNTTVTPGGQNLLRVVFTDATSLHVISYLHSLDAADKLQVPDDDRLRLFFGQLDRFIKKGELFGPGHNPQRALE